MQLVKNVAERTGALTVICSGKAMGQMPLCMIILSALRRSTESKILHGRHTTHIARPVMGHSIFQSEKHKRYWNRITTCNVLHTQKMQRSCFKHWKDF